MTRKNEYKNGDKGGNRRNKADEQEERWRSNF